MDLEAFSEVITRDMERVLRCREYCRAQEALLKSKMQLSAGVTSSKENFTFPHTALTWTVQPD